MVSTALVKSVSIPEAKQIGRESHEYFVAICCGRKLSVCITCMYICTPSTENVKAKCVSVYTANIDIYSVDCRPPQSE